VPNSPEIPQSRIGGLRDYLAAVFPHATAQLAPQTEFPLLLLRFPHAIYGMAFANGDLRASFEQTYAAFKKLVLGDGSLRNTEPAFVFCIAPGLDNVEQFTSSVETDVYFCRKFVIALTDDLGRSLASLPFMPLAPIDGVALRPASAQTYLQRLGVPVLLARHLVIPTERSAQGICEDCVAEKHGKPFELKPAGPTAMQEVEPSQSGVYLQKITMKNIRAYRREQSIELGEYMTVLYGPNGFGKTSFFDAVDFGVTGSVGRLPPETDPHVRKTVQHLDSTGDDAYVKIEFVRDGVPNTIVRHIANRKTADLNGTSADRKRVLSELTNTSAKVTERVENYVSLFRATHLFSQEVQELTKNFKDDCVLSADIVYRMLAVEDYASAKKKAEDARDLFEQALEREDSNLARIQAEIAIEQERLDKLSAATTAPATSNGLASFTAGLRAQLQSEQLSVVLKDNDLESLRAQRSIVDARLNQHQTTLTRLTGLVAAVRDLPSLLASSQTLDSQIQAGAAALAEAQQQVLALAPALEQAKQTLQAAERSAAEVRSRLDDHRWRVTTLPAQRQADSNLDALRSGVEQDLTALAQLQGAQQTRFEQLSQLEREIRPAEEQLAAKQAQAERLQPLIAVFPAQLRKADRVQEIVRTDGEIQNNLTALVATHEASTRMVTDLQGEAQTLNAQLAASRGRADELASLLTAIEDHIADGNCPVCGVDHGSKENLLELVRQRREMDATGALESAVRDINDRLRAAQAAARDAAAKVAAARATLASLARERAGLDTELAEYNQSVNAFALDPVSDRSAAKAQALLDRVAVEIAELRQALETLRTQEQEARRLHAAAVLAVRDKQAALATRRDSRTAAEAFLQEIMSDRRWEDSAAARTEVELKAEEQQLTSALANATQAVADATKARDAEQAAVDAARRLVTQTNSDLTKLRAQHSEISKALIASRTALAGVSLPDDTDSASLASAIEQQQSDLSRAQALHDALVNLELAMDAAATAAALLSQQNAIKEKEQELKRVTFRKKARQPWAKLFRAIVQQLQSQQGQAVSNFTDQYGPRTSVIQRRLRSVYSFEDVEITARDAAIVVRVRRGKDNLKPVDYFSQSQQQTLLLGLFLTACSSQTWSSFSSIFLDDPVTHFDDLNTFALLDLLIGLLNTNVGKRQFVISTCDEKLLQLALRKFQHLGDKAKFYRFEAIGNDGPVIREIKRRVLEAVA
jgi:DNA repair protein SbcC/Rad50